jgi:peptide/nickel transport system permease protein
MSPSETLPSAEPTAGRPRTLLRNCLRQPSAVIGASIVLVFVVLALGAPWLAPYDPNESDWMAIREAPTFAHWFGTDDLGRDVLSRIVFGARASLAVGGVSVAIAIAIGVPLGLLAGYAGGITDTIVSRFTDALLACPFLVLAIALAAFLGASLENAMIAIGISSMPVFTRLTRGQVMTITTEEYIDAARLQGVRDTKILLAYVLPNVLSPIVVQSTISMATAVLAEASLAFLGLGQRPPDPSWGTMLDVARQFLTEAPWMPVWPGAAIIALVMGFNLLGDGLNDALDPRNGD